MRIVVVGDIHTQAAKLWRILKEAGLADEPAQASQSFLEDDTQLILLGDLVHAKGREQYAKLTGVTRYDEYNPEHVEKAEKQQEIFLKEVKAFQEQARHKITIIMGNHDYNAVHNEQGPLRSDDVSHLEWRDITNRALEPELKLWIKSWPYEYSLEGIHFAHVGPLKEHNTYDNDFYLHNRRRWIYEDKDYMDATPYKIGVYGHTPVRGGVNIASKGRAILLDANGYADEYMYLDVQVNDKNYNVKMRGLVFDEIIQR